jgi:AraC-like DNA-binding protein
VPEALRSRRLAAVDGLAVSLVSCGGGDRRWEPVEEACGPQVVFVRRGVFARRVNGVESLLDATVVYFATRGAEEQFAHPAGHGDECLSIGLPERFVDEVGAEPDRLPDRPVYTSAAIDLAHRRLAREAGRGCDGFELHERIARLVGGLLEAARPRPPVARSATLAARRRLVACSRAALLEDRPRGLVELSRAVGSSPFHLSRVFSEETGQTLSAYRNRLRVAMALDRLEQGERDLAGLAAELGFADQAHMTRVLRAQLGDTPSQVRRVLAQRN